MKMKTIQLMASALCLSLFVSCSDDESSIEEKVLEVQSVTDLPAEQTADYTTNPPTITGDYTKFSFATGTSVTGDNWDVAFRGTTILVNGGTATLEDQPARTGDGGAYVINGLLADVTAAAEASFKEDDVDNGLAIPTGSGNGWYNYNPMNNTITPIAGKVIVVRTHDGKYAKMEITSYYKDGQPAEDLSNSQHYSFNYVYQPEGSTF